MVESRCFGQLQEFAYRSVLVTGEKEHRADKNQRSVFADDFDDVPKPTLGLGPTRVAQHQIAVQIQCMEEVPFERDFVFDDS